MATETFLYETLTPVALSTAPDSPPPSPAPPSPAPPPQLSDDSEPWIVFKNEISAAPLHSPTKNAAAPEDYFSLDISLDNGDLNGFLTPPPSLKPVKSASKVEPERTLESGWFRGNSRYESPMLQLHKEILDFCDFLSPTPEEQSSRNAAVESVFDVIRYIWPNCRVEVFGSFKTGLYLPSSDIDVVILGSDIRTPQTGLHALSRALSQRGVAKKIQVIAKARVPIIKFLEKKSSIAFDISFDVDNGPKAAEFIKDAISKLPPLRPLCLILKIFLQQRELNEVYSGGIGSYALLVMIIAMLQNHWKSQTYPQHNLGILLVNFFEFYGRKLNTWDVGISCRKSGTFYSKSKRGFSVQGRPFLISIEDPQTPENDIGKNSFNYFQIKSAFAMALSTLTNARTIMDLGPHRSILGTIIRPDAVLLERKGGSNGEMTFNNLLPGAGEPLEPQYGKQQGIVGNWLFGADEEEEPLPRSNGFIAADSTSPCSSGKKRKSPKEKFKKKLKENGNGVLLKHRENGLRKDKSAKKKRRWESR